LSKEVTLVTEIQNPLPDVALLTAQVKLAQRAHELGIKLTPEQREELARAALEGGVPYLDGVGPDLGWPPLPDPES
jgi:hypothetical protein